MKSPYKTCPHCSWRYMDPKSKYCDRCGEAVEPNLPVILLEDPNYCTNCGQITDKWAKYCNKCGGLTYIGENANW